MSWANLRIRVGAGSPAAPVATGGVQMRVRASDTPAPTTTPLPIVPPSPGTRVGVADSIAAAEALLLWNFLPRVSPPGESPPPVYADYAWRWRKHQALPVDSAPSSGEIGPDGDGMFVGQAAFTVGDVGPLQPYLAIDSLTDADLVDARSTPIWCLVVDWVIPTRPTQGGLAPDFTASTTAEPGLPILDPQPIIGDTNSQAPWLLYVQWSASWIGGPGDWVLLVTPSLVLSYGGEGSPIVTRTVENVAGGPSVVELDTTNQRLRLWGASAWIDAANPGEPGGWPIDHVFGAANMGPSFAQSFRHLNGHIMSVAVVPQTLETTVDLLATRSVVPGTGAPMASMTSFRAAPVPRRSVGRLSLHAHYWPLDDPSSPMVDLVAGVPLDVINPTLATFQVAGIANPLTPTHTQALRLDRASDLTSATATYLQWGGTGTAPSIGAGAVGDDVTIGCWIRWEGPPAQLSLAGSLGSLGIFQAQTIPFGGVFEPSLSLDTYSLAEPFGIQLQTWDSVADTFETLQTDSFDWPADYLLDTGAVEREPPPTPYDTPIPYKGPVWAHVAAVLRTVSAQMTMEIWVDGVLIAQQVGSDNGWGADTALHYVAKNLAPCTIQHLTMWPFALDPDEIAEASRID